MFILLTLLTLLILFGSMLKSKNNVKNNVKNNIKNHVKNHVIGENTIDVNDNRIAYRANEIKCDCHIGLSKREIDQKGGNNMLTASCSTCNQEKNRITNKDDIEYIKYLKDARLEENTIRECQSRVGVVEIPKSTRSVNHFDLRDPDDFNEEKSFLKYFPSQQFHDF